LKDSFDVIVCGGGPAGIAAAVCAARMNMSVCIIEQTGCFGGMSTSGLVQFFAHFSDGEKVLVGNFGTEVLKRLRHKKGTSPEDKPDKWNWVVFNNEILKLVYDEMAEESGISIKFFSTVLDVWVEDGTVNSILVSGGKGVYTLRGKVFVDATGDGFVAFMAGAPFWHGDEEGNTQASTLCSVYSNVDWETYYRFLKDTQQEGNLPKTLREAIKDGAFSVPDYHLPAGAFRTGFALAGMNVGHVFGGDMTDSDELSSAMIKGRKVVQEYLNFYKKYVPGFSEAELVSTGSLLGVRETRRIIGEYVLNIDDFLARSSFKDEIGRYNYPVDLHASSSSVADYEEFEENFQTLAYDTGDSYGIPYRSLVPKSVKNLLVAGRCMSTDRKMQASIRVMPCCFLTGQAAGTAAALYVKEDIKDVRDVNITMLRDRLRQDGVYML
jgi:hypothetical protein